MSGVSENKGEVIKLKIPSRPAFIRKTRKVIDEMCLRSNFSKKHTRELKLAINEALANIIQHAYENDPDQTIYLYLLIMPDKVEVILRDFGKKPSPSSLKIRDLDELEDKGLGILFMKKYVDHMAYNFSDKGGNQLKFIKYKDSTDMHYFEIQSDFS